MFDSGNDINSSFMRYRYRGKVKGRQHDAPLLPKTHTAQQVVADVLRIRFVDTWLTLADNLYGGNIDG